MKKFKIVPISKEVVQKITSLLADDFGHKLSPVKLKSRALCRHSLSDGDINSNQEHILFSYMPVYDLNPYSEVGPVYIIKGSAEYLDIYVFPPDLKKREFLTVRGYTKEQILTSGQMSKGEAIENVIELFFENELLDYILISDATSGCFFVKIARP